MKNPNALLVSLLMATMLTTGCSASMRLTGGGNDAPSATAEASDIAPTGNMTVLRSGHTATLLPDGQVLIAGGYDNRSLASARAWLYRA